VNSTTLLLSPDQAVLTQPSRMDIRPRYEGANIGTWIGFKHLNYLVEEAVLHHLRQHELSVTSLYHRYGLCIDIVDIDTRILHALHVDDLAIAEVVPDESTKDGRLRFAVSVRREPGAPKAVKAKVVVELRHDTAGYAAEEPEEWLRELSVDRLGATQEAKPIPLKGGSVRDTLIDGTNAFLWTWRIPYFYCHFTERLQMSGYLRLMEEVVDLFLVDRGVSVKTLLDERKLIPAVPHSTIRFLGEARMEEQLHTVFTVEEVFKRLTYTARMDTYVVRDDQLVPTATGRITHGYARIEGRGDWGLVSFDDRLTGALSGTPAGTD
jgi:acyl-CoA thioesterase FadM